MLFLKVHNSPEIGLIFDMNFPPLEFFPYFRFIRSRMLILLVACDPGIWPAIVTQGPGDRMLAVQISQGVSFLPL